MMKDTAQKSRSRSNPNSRKRETAKSSAEEWKEVLLFYVLPFLLLNGFLFVYAAAKPHITIQVANTKDYKTTTASITVQSLFPIKEFRSAQEGTDLVLTEEKKGHYTADIVRNGVIEIYAKGLNGIAATEYEHVNILDDVAPLVGEQYNIQDGILTITLEDSQSGVDYQSVFAISSSGQSFLPLSADRQSSTFTFPMEEDFLVIYANDLAGNGMQATFSTHIETLGPDEVPAGAFPDNAVNGEAALPAQEEAALPAQEEAIPTDSLAFEPSSLPAAGNSDSTEFLENPNHTEPAQESSDGVTIHIHTKTP